MTTRSFTDGEEISTLVAKDGKPLDSPEQEKENQRTRKRIEEIQKQQSKKEAKEEKRKEKGRRKKTATTRESKSFFAFASS